MTVNWQLLSPVHKPSARSRTVFVYDPVRDLAWLLCGDTNLGFVVETWKWDGTDWTQLFPVLSPTSTGSPNFDIFIAYGGGYHKATDRVVVHGITRRGATTYLNADTWLWDPNALNWVHPSPGHQAFNATLHESGGGSTLSAENPSNKVYHFGGNGTAGPTRTTGYWNGTDWINFVPATLPIADPSAALGYDPIRKRVVAYMGNAVGRPTYEWNGLDWTLITTAHTPPLYSGGTLGTNLGWHPSLKKLILAVPTVFNGTCETWSYDGVDWIRIITVTSMPSVNNGCMTRDPSRSDALVHHGGQNTGAATFRDETWILVDSAPTVSVPTMNNLVKLDG